jgi:diguanylate cyclase
MNREYKNIDATLTGLNHSSDAHFKWLVKILYCVANKKSILPEITDHDAHENCEFGLWLGEELKDERDDKSYLLDIYKKHEEIHQVSRDLLRSLHRGEMSVAEFDDF